MCNICTTCIWAHGAGPKKAAGPMGPKARDPGPWAQGLGPRRRFGPGPMGPYVFCTYVAHMLYIIPIYFIFMTYLFHIPLSMPKLFISYYWKYG